MYLTNYLNDASNFWENFDQNLLVWPHCNFLMKSHWSWSHCDFLTGKSWSWSDTTKAGLLKPTRPGLSSWGRNHNEHDPLDHEDHHQESWVMTIRTIMLLICTWCRWNLAACWRVILRSARKPQISWISRFWSSAENWYWSPSHYLSHNKHKHYTTSSLLHRNKDLKWFLKDVKTI